GTSAAIWARKGSCASAGSKRSVVSVRRVGSSVVRSSRISWASVLRKEARRRASSRVRFSEDMGPSCHRARPLRSASGQVQVPAVVLGQPRQLPGGVREEVLVAGGEGVGPLGDVLLGLATGGADPLDLLGAEVAGALGALELVLVLVVPVAARQDHQVEHQVAGAHALLGPLVGGLEVDVVAAQRA